MDRKGIIVNENKMIKDKVGCVIYLYHSFTALNHDLHCWITMFHIHSTHTADTIAPFIVIRVSRFFPSFLMSL